MSGHNPAIFTQVLNRRYFDLVSAALAADPSGGLCTFHGATTREADLGITFLSHAANAAIPEPAMLAATQIALEKALAQPQRPGRLRLETPSGLIEVLYRPDRPGRAQTKIVNVPAFIYGINYDLNVSGVGHVSADIVFDGAFYAVINRGDAKLPQVHNLFAASEQVCAQLEQMETIVHPDRPYLCGVSRVLWPMPPRHRDADVRSHVIEVGEHTRFVPNAGLSARALHRAVMGHGLWGAHQKHETVSGSLLDIVGECPSVLAERPAGLVTFSGSAKTIGPASFPAS